MGIDPSSAEELSRKRVDNGSFTFTVTDAAGNRSELTVTVSHLRDFLPGDVNDDDTVDSADAIYLLYNVFFGDEDYPLY